MDKMLIFDIWGRYAHYKKIFVTTSPLSYVIPSKISLYGYIGAILGLEKRDNLYLKKFELGQCRMGLQVMRPIRMQRISTNLYPHNNGILTSRQNRKPTMMEYIYRPKYRIFFTHQDEEIFQKLETSLKEHKTVYTPTLGLANLISNFESVGNVSVSGKISTDKAVEIESIIPVDAFKQFDFSPSKRNEIIEYSQYPVEINTHREVTKRTDVLIDRGGNTINAFVNYYNEYNLNEQKHKIILF